MSWLANLLGIGRITLVDDDGEVQRLQVTETAIGGGYRDRVTNDVFRVSEFGFAGVPPLDAEVLVLNRGADRSQPIAIATSHRASRPHGKPGDSGIYDIRGAKVMLTEDGFEIDCAGLPARIHDATTLTIVASGTVRIEAPQLEVTGDVISRADGAPVSLNALRDAYQAHKHAGVQAGGGTTGPTDHDA